MIKREDYQLMAQIIRSDQISPADAVKVMDANPEFYAWYKTKYLGGNKDVQTVGQAYEPYAKKGQSADYSPYYAVPVLGGILG